MIDLLGKNTDGLKQKRLFQFDLDGTVYNDGVLYEGAAQLFSRIRQIGGDYAFITNNSSSSAADCLVRLEKMGIPANEKNFCTASQATAQYIAETYPDQLVYVMGTESLMKELKLSGIRITTEVTDKASIVLVGFDTELTSAKLRDTCEMLTKDNIFIATNPDLACPASFGFIPDCGSICQMLTNASGRTPQFIGKPAPVMVQTLMKRFNCGPENTVVVGDRLYTDIAAGVNAGAETVCVLTGEATMQSIAADPVHPTYVLYSVKQLYEALL